MGAAMGGIGAPPVTAGLLSVTGTKNGNGDNELIAAPGAKVRIVITSITLQNESTTATTMILKAGSTAFLRVLGQNQGNGRALDLPPGREYRLPLNTALNLNLSGANQCGYTIFYYLE